MFRRKKKQSGINQLSDISIGNHDPFNFVHSGVVKDFLELSGTSLNIDDDKRKLVGQILANSYRTAAKPQSIIDELKIVLPNKSDDELDAFIRTEFSRMFNKANMKGFLQADIEKIRYLAIIDNHTCPICRERHNQVYYTHNAPMLPCHDGCRCMYVAVFE